MIQPITNYTTYDQAYYYADLRGLPRLSETDRQSLIADLSAAGNPRQITQIKQQLMESYLHFAKHYAIDLCHQSCYHRDLPDLIGIANLTVVEVISRTDLTQAVLRLRYGLSDDNERRHTTAEIVRLLGIRRTEVQRIEREALVRVRAFVEGKATLVLRNGKSTIDYPAVQNRLRITPEQETAWSATGLALQAQGVAVTAR